MSLQQTLHQTFYQTTRRHPPLPSPPFHLARMECALQFFPGSLWRQNLGRQKLETKR